jgi:hypothetical protein
MGLRDEAETAFNRVLISAGVATDKPCLEALAIANGLVDLDIALQRMVIRCLVPPQAVATFVQAWALSMEAQLEQNRARPGSDPS